MPLLATPYPHVFNSLNGPSAPEHTFLIFYSIVVNGRMWCPDCVNVEPTVREAFDGENKPKAVIYWVGSLAEWRSPENKARVEYNVHNVPTILRLENGKEAARLVEDDILDERKLDAFIYPTKV